MVRRSRSHPRTRRIGGALNVPKKTETTIPGPSRDVAPRPSPPAVSRQDRLNSVMSITKRGPDGAIGIRPQTPVLALIFYLHRDYSAGWVGAGEAASMVASAVQVGPP